MPHANICLFTSIRLPTDPEATSYLRDCLNSWRMAGFDAVAVNGPAETEALRPLDLPVEFAVTAADGKPRIGTILSAIRARGCRFAGVINSDCRIIGYPNAAAGLRASLDKTAMLAWRIDVGPDLKPATMRGGFDAYFFDTDVMPLDDSGFSIGDPLWDYWFPLACEMSGARVETLAVPLLTHKAHPANWNEQSFIRSGERLWAAFQGWYQRGVLPVSLLAQIPIGWRLDGTLSLDQLGHLSSIIPAWLHDNRPQTIAIMGPQGAEVEAVLRFCWHAMQLAELADTRKAERDELARLAESRNAALAEIRDSTSWRMTAPLRAAAAAARRFASTLKPRPKRLATDGRTPMLGG